jgi:hypothetical protein
MRGEAALLVVGSLYRSENGFEVGTNDPASGVMAFGQSHLLKKEQACVQNATLSL